MPCCALNRNRRQLRPNLLNLCQTVDTDGWFDTRSNLKIYIIKINIYVICSSSTSISIATTLALHLVKPPLTDSVPITLNYKGLVTENLHLFRVTAELKWDTINYSYLIQKHSQNVAFHRARFTRVTKLQFTWLTFICVLQNIILKQYSFKLSDIPQAKTFVKRFKAPVFKRLPNYQWQRLIGVIITVPSSN